MGVWFHKFPLQNRGLNGQTSTYPCFFAFSRVLGTGLSPALRRIRYLRYRHLCRLSGTFRTRYQQRLGDLEAKREALTRIEQHGLRIRATTTELATQRTWHLDGEVDCSGFVRGTYRAAASGPELGNFLLSIDRNGDALTGLWTRFDSMRREVLSGESSMERC
jgi:hypothetical protein